MMHAAAFLILCYFSFNNRGRGWLQIVLQKKQTTSQKKTKQQTKNLITEAIAHFKRKDKTIIKSPSQNAYAKKI